VQYNVCDTETSCFYPGTYLGTKKIVAVGTGFDRQKDYHAYASDLFVDYPLGRGALSGQFDFNRFDGGATLRTLPRQNDVLLELGYFVGSAKLMPVVQFARRRLVDTAKSDESRISVGANYWWAGHNANVKAAYTRIDPAGLATQHEFTVQGRKTLAIMPERSREVGPVRRDSRDSGVRESSSRHDVVLGVW